MHAPDTAQDWLQSPRQPQSEDEVMYVDVDGYEGPLDLLLDLARRQKVDVARISVLALAEQYLAFIDKVRKRRIEIAADYLVMAAWLAYLKSRLMVPQQPSDEEPSGEMMAAMLQFRLQRLEAMRKAARALFEGTLLGRDQFARGAPEPVAVARRSAYDTTLFELLKAYASQCERAVPNDYAPQSRSVWSLQQARDILERLVGASMDWVPLDQFLAEYLGTPADRATVMASSFTASLELARQGMVELRQNAAFAPLLLRRRAGDGHADD